MAPLALAVSEKFLFSASFKEEEGGVVESQNVIESWHAHSCSNELTLNNWIGLLVETAHN